MCSRCSPRLCICLAAPPRLTAADAVYVVLVSSGFALALCGLLGLVAGP